MSARLSRRRTRAAMILAREEAAMPLTKKGAKIKRSMESQYGKKKGDSVFYASINKGKIKGAEGRSKKR